MFSALIVEDDQKLSSLYSSYLGKQGYQTFEAYDADEAMRLFETTHIDIVLCDILMPGIDGVMLAGAIRKANPEVPIMMLTALGDIASKQRAFSVEVDDYMVKPVDLNELAMRMTALLRRAHSVSKRRIIIGEALLDADSLAVTEGGTVTVLPLKEFMILFKLCSAVGHVFTRRDIMNDIWGLTTESDVRTVDVHVKRLRQRFSGSASFRIETVRGVGYKATALA